MKKMLYILGDALAQETGLPAFLCMGMLRLSIETRCGSNEIKVVDTFIETLGFRDWESLLADENLAKRLAVQGVQDPLGHLARARKMLIERQSLFTMSVK